MGRKQYELTVPVQEPSGSRALDAGMQDAILLSMLENKMISLWEYEQCRGKLHRPPP